MFPRRAALALSLGMASVALAATSFVPSAVYAAPDGATQNKPAPPRYDKEGRPAAPVPITLPATNGGVEPVQVGTPLVDDAGLLYEKQRIKRTVPMEIESGLSGKWDPLYSVMDPNTGRRTFYFDWDAQYLYFAVESPAAEDIRFDLDGDNNGWLRGRDNLSVQISPDPSGGPARVNAQRLDTETSRDYPVWDASPVPVGAMKVVTGKTPQGTFATLFALPRTELIGLKREAGRPFGLRIETGVSPAPVGDAGMVSLRPLLRLALADSIPASGQGLTLKINIAGSREVTVGDGIRATLEARNDGATPLHIARLFMRGSQSAQSYLDAATFTGVEIAPGARITRELRSAVSPGTPVGSLVLTGGAEWGDGSSIAALSSFDRVEPYSVRADADDKPVTVGASGVSGGARKVTVTVKSRVKEKASVRVALALPPGWSLDTSEPTREFTLSGIGSVGTVTYNVLAPGTAAPGVYPVDASVTVGGKTYQDSATIHVAAAPQTATTAQP